MDTESMKIVHDNDSYAVPIPQVREVLDYLEYASQERTMFEMLYYTGCRPSELDRMDPNLLYENTLYWYPGKGQKNWRKEVLPASFIEELHECRKRHRVPANRFWGMKQATFRRSFDNIRKHLSSAWWEKRLIPRSRAFGLEYVLQLRGLRKTFQTMLFAKEFEHWKSAEVALEFTSKRMRHSSKHMTAYHYLQHFESLHIKEMSCLEPDQVIKPVVQTRMIEY